MFEENLINCAGGPRYRKGRHLENIGEATGNILEWMRTMLKDKSDGELAVGLRNLPTSDPRETCLSSRSPREEKGKVLSQMYRPK